MSRNTNLFASSASSASPSSPQQDEEAVVPEEILRLSEANPFLREYLGVLRDFHKRELAEAKAAAARLRTSAKQTAADFEESVAEREELRADMARARDNLARAQSEKAALSHEAEALKEELEGLRAKLNEVAGQSHKSDNINRTTGLNPSLQKSGAAKATGESNSPSRAKGAPSPTAAGSIIVDVNAPKAEIRERVNLLQNRLFVLETESRTWKNEKAALELELKRATVRSQRVPPDAANYLNLEVQNQLLLQMLRQVGHHHSNAAHASAGAGGTSPPKRSPSSKAEESSNNHRKANTQKTIPPKGTTARGSSSQPNTSRQPTKIANAARGGSPRGAQLTQENRPHLNNPTIKANEKKRTGGGASDLVQQSAPVLPAAIPLEVERLQQKDRHISSPAPQLASSTSTGPSTVNVSAVNNKNVVMSKAGNSKHSTASTATGSGSSSAANLTVVTSSSNRKPASSEGVHLVRRAIIDKEDEEIKSKEKEAVRGVEAVAAPSSEPLQEGTNRGEEEEEGQQQEEEEHVAALLSHSSDEETEEVEEFVEIVEEVEEFEEVEEIPEPPNDEDEDEDREEKLEGTLEEGQKRDIHATLYDDEQEEEKEKKAASDVNVDTKPVGENTMEEQHDEDNGASNEKEHLLGAAEADEKPHLIDDRGAEAGEGKQEQEEVEEIEVAEEVEEVVEAEEEEKESNDNKAETGEEEVEKENTENHPSSDDDDANRVDEHAHTPDTNKDDADEISGVDVAADNLEEQQQQGEAEEEVEEEYEEVVEEVVEEEIEEAEPAEDSNDLTTNKDTHPEL